MKLKDIAQSIETLPGIGPALARQFARLNIFTIGDLLSTFPKNYEDRTHRVSLRDFDRESKVHTICQVLSHEWFGYGRMKTLKIKITDGLTSATLVAFNRAFLEKSLPQGSIILVTGKFEYRYNELQSSSFEASRLALTGNIQEYIDYPLPDRGVLAVYPLTEGLSQKSFRKTQEAALKLYAKTIDNEIPDNLIRERSLLDKKDAVTLIHRPNNISDIQKARNTLIYEELYNFEYKMAQRALEHRGVLPSLEQTAAFEFTGNNKNDVVSAAPFFRTPDQDSSNIESLKQTFIDSLSPKQKALYDILSFELTEGQIQAIKEMNTDIDRSQTEFNNMLINKFTEQRNPFSMQRLLQGDVGSGKTLVSFFVCLREIDYGNQCAILAPTELLAKQHAENASKLLGSIGIRVAFLTGNLKTKGRDLLLNALKDANIDIVIGTHALFSNNVTYRNLGLVVIDEQHRFGVAQRESIINKGRKSLDDKVHSPDLLMMSATPIPQTLALTAFGDLDVSTIKTMPKGRKPIKTYLSVMGHEDNVYSAVRKELMAGHQSYFVYPRIGEAEGDILNEDTGDKNSEIKAAQEMFDYLSQKVYPDFKCALVHSKIDEEEQHRILDDFAKGEIKILVATTVVEVGVDVANATCIVIEHADRFGLAELHQLRGRVGRSDLQSYCFLIYSKNITETGISRMKILHESNDGFVIAEEDLKLRGPGEVTGTAQSGYLSLNIADLSRDKEILMMARYDAFTQLKNQAT